MKHIDVDALGYDSDALFERASALSQQLKLTIDKHKLPRLQLTDDKLVLLFDNFSQIYVDFTLDGSWKSRIIAGKKQGLVKACKPAKGLRILDATAGWGRDAAILSHMGATVVMLERSPLMRALLADGLSRLPADSSLKERVSLIFMDAFDYLSELTATDFPDVIYIDPMHPERRKSALVKKEMQVLHQLIGPDRAPGELVELAMKRVKQRVVVKWPQRLPPVLAPDFTIGGKTVRFDVFLKH